MARHVGTGWARRENVGVARNTALRAVGYLADEGLVQVVSGWGTFVR